MLSFLLYYYIFSTYVSPVNIDYCCQGSVACIFVYFSFLYNIVIIEKKKISGYYEITVIYLFSIHCTRYQIAYWYKILFSYLQFPMESFAFILVEYQNEKDVTYERYFRMLSEIDIIDFYFYRAEISCWTASFEKYTPSIVRDFSSTKQNRHMFCWNTLFWKSTTKKRTC